MNKNSLNGLIAQTLKDNFNRDAFSNYEQQPITFAGVAERILAIHAYYAEIGLQHGDKVALYCRNDVHWAVIYLATVSYGAVIVPILADFHPSDVEHIIVHSDSRLLFLSDLMADKIHVKGNKNLLDVVSVQQLKAKHSGIFILAKVPLRLTAEDIVFEEFNEHTTAVISYTSGTSGNSKGVMLSHRNIWSNARFGWDAQLDLGPGDKVVSFLPLAHAYGCLFEFLAPYVMGSHVVFLTRIPSPQIILKAFGEIKPKLILAVPLVIEKIFRKKIQPVINKPVMKLLLKVPGLNQILYRKINKSLTHAFGGHFIEVIIGGAAFNPEVEKFFMKIGFRLTIGYGMTECGPLISYSGWKQHKLGSAGTVVNRMQVRINSEDAAKVPGEIEVNGKNVMLGYYKNPEATREVFTEDGWLKTGDLGVFVDDHVFIKGRNKSMILGASGQNIYPEEIENLINHHEFVLECLVRDNKGRLEALILPDIEYINSIDVSLDEVKERILSSKLEWNKKLPAYSKVALITFVSQEFEKTPKKSIKRFLYNIEL